MDTPKNDASEGLWADGDPFGQPRHRQLVGCLVALVTSLAQPFWRAKDRAALQECVDALQRYSDGEEVTREQILEKRRAASACAAYAAADAASAYAAYAAASASAASVAASAYAAYAYAAAYASASASASSAAAYAAAASASSASAAYDAAAYAAASAVGAGQQ